MEVLPCSHVATLVMYMKYVYIWGGEEALQVLPKNILRWSGKNRANLYKFGLFIRENVFVFTFKVNIYLHSCLCQSDSESILILHSTS